MCVCHFRKLCPPNCKSCTLIQTLSVSTQLSSHPGLVVPLAGQPQSILRALVCAVSPPLREAWLLHLLHAGICLSQAFQWTWDLQLVTRFKGILYPIILLYFSSQHFTEVISCYLFNSFLLLPSTLKCKFFLGRRFIHLCLYPYN